MKCTDRVIGIVKIIGAILVCFVTVYYVLSPDFGFGLDLKSNPNNVIYLIVIYSMLLISGIIDVPAKTMSKGLLLVVVAIMINMFNEYIYELVKKAHSTDILKSQFDVFKDIILLAFAAAGGSLIAEHAKTKCKDAGSDHILVELPSIKRHINSLEFKVNLLIGFIALLCTLIVILILKL